MKGQHPDFAQFRLNEAIRPSLSPVTIRGVSGLRQASTGPRYFDVNGNTITAIQCGQPYLFEVPGYTQVWLKVTKDGKTTYDGLFNVPMPAYTSICETDPGHYETIALDPSTMNEIGRTTLDVSGGGFLGLSTTTLLLIGGAALLLMTRKRG